MRIRMNAVRTWAAVLAAGGAIVATQAPALATSAPVQPTLTISAKSHLPKVTGDTWVFYAAGKASVAQISGTITNASAGQVVRLFARQFPYTKKPVQVGPTRTLSPTGSTAHYSFKVTPTLATKYKAVLYANSTVTTPEAGSPTTIVYVAATSVYSGVQQCARPTCHETVHVHTFVPPSALGTEMRKRWFAYFGLNLSATGTPSRPKHLTLGAGNIRASSSRRLSDHEYAMTLTMSFTVGNDGYYFLFNACQKDTESKDGLNLPGRHDCGATTISSSLNYLGASVRG